MEHSLMLELQHRLMAKAKVIVHQPVSHTQELQVPDETTSLSVLRYFVTSQGSGSSEMKKYQCMQCSALTLVYLLLIQAKESCTHHPHWPVFFIRMSSPPQDAPKASDHQQIVSREPKGSYSHTFEEPFMMPQTCFRHHTRLATPMPFGNNCREQRPQVFPHISARCQTVLMSLSHHGDPTRILGKSTSVYNQSCLKYSMMGALKLHIRIRLLGSLDPI